MTAILEVEGSYREFLFDEMPALTATIIQFFIRLLWCSQQNADCPPAYPAYLRVIHTLRKLHNNYPFSTSIIA